MLELCDGPPVSRPSKHVSGDYSGGSVVPLSDLKEGGAHWTCAVLN